MSAVSGVVSRQVLPVCGSLCFFCPALRARSRQPVKRYKKLIADIFPRNQVSIFWLSLMFHEIVIFNCGQERIMKEIVAFLLSKLILVLAAFIELGLVAVNVFRGYGFA